MLCMYTFYVMYTTMYMCTIYIYLFGIPLSMHVYFVCLLCMYARYVSVMCNMYIYYVSHVYEYCINLSIYPSVCPSVHMCFAYILCVYTVFVSRSYFVYLCCVCIWCPHSVYRMYTIVFTCPSICQSVYLCMCALCVYFVCILCMYTVLCATCVCYVCILCMVGVYYIYLSVCPSICLCMCALCVYYVCMLGTDRWGSFERHG